MIVRILFIFNFSMTDGEHLAAADLYLILFDIVRKNPDAVGHGPEGYYFVENLDYSSLEAAQAISETLFELEVASSKEPTPFTQEELEKNFQVRFLIVNHHQLVSYADIYLVSLQQFWPVLATNCYARADRSRAIGWKPTGTKADFLANIKAEVKELLSQSK